MLHFYPTTSLTCFYPHNVADFFRHYKYMNACLSRQTVPMPSKIIPKLVDHRYFYNEWIQEDCVGNYTCGLARNAVAVELRANEWDFADTDFLKSLPDYKEQYVHLRDVSHDIWNRYEAAKKREMIQRAPEEHTRVN